MINKSNLPVPIPDICAPREKLVERIDTAAKKSLVFFQSPGGYGKSVSILLWLRKSGLNSAWRCFDEYDDSPALFYLLFCRSLFAILPSNEELLSVLESPAFRDAPVELTIDILSKADFGSEKVVLVLDDFHTINSEPILKALPFVLKRLPDNIIVFFLSRGVVPVVFEQFFNTEIASLLGVDDFTLSAEEIHRHVESYGLKISANRTQELRGITGGWIFLLNLIITSGDLKTGAEKGKVSIDNYFEKTIWKSLDDRLCEFLLKTAIPDSFSLELCEALTGNNKCEETLMLLERKNVNISLISGEYRYHQLFLDFLRGKLEVSGISLSEVYCKTAQYYIEKSDFIAARRFAVMSGELDVMVKAAGMINTSKNVNVDDYARLANILNKNQLPDAVCEAVPFFYLQKAYVAYLMGSSKEFEYYWDRIYALLPVIADKFPQFVETNVTNSIIDYRYSFAGHPDRISGMPDIINKNDFDQVSGIAINLPFLHRSSRDCYELTDTSVREKVIDKVFRKLLNYDCDNLFLGIEAGLLLEQSKPDQARKLLNKSEKLLNDKVSIDIGWSTYIMLAETALIKKDLNDYERYKLLAREYFEKREAFYYIRNFNAYETRTKLWNADTGAADEWLSQYFVCESEYGALYKIYQNFTTARAHIVLGNCEEARKVLDGIMRVSEAFDRMLDLAEAEVLLAVAEWYSSEKKHGSLRLQRVLERVQPYNFKRIIANEGAAVLPILRSVEKRLARESKKNQGSENTSLRRFAREVYYITYKQSRQFKGIARWIRKNTVRLSPKQTVIIKMLSEGYRNADIIKATGYSINTIRSYTKIMYAKLEVNRAADAVAKARELGYI